MTGMISLNNLCVDFPIYSFIGNRSLKRTFINIATGGVLASDVRNRPIVCALSNITFTLKEGDRVGIVGHNGSGKTTLLQVLAGIYEPTAGSLNIVGTITSMLGISVGMDMEASGSDNILLRGGLMGMSKAEIESKLDEIVDFSGLGEFIHMPVKTYSTGMAMRLAFSIVTSKDADILLMDEWLSVGDQEFVQKANKRMDEMAQNARIVVFASHDQKTLSQRSNKIIKLEHGKLVDFL
jgi:lipopolysaccharide transport system ATP-binding protein